MIYMLSLDPGDNVPLRAINWLHFLPLIEKEQLFLRLGNIC